MPQSPSDTTPKTASEAMFEIPNLEDTDEVTNYFNLTVQSVWGTVVGMVETQRRMLKQIQTIRHNYNRISDMTDSMLKHMSSPYTNSLVKPKQSLAANILLSNKETAKKDIRPANSNPSGNGNQTKVTSESDQTEESTTHIKNLWKRK